MHIHIAQASHTMHALGPAGRYMINLPSVPNAPILQPGIRKPSPGIWNPLHQLRDGYVKVCMFCVRPVSPPCHTSYMPAVNTFRILAKRRRRTGLSGGPHRWRTSCAEESSLSLCPGPGGTHPAASSRSPHPSSGGKYPHMTSGKDE